MKGATKMVSDYYSDKIKKHGISPEGVDWNGHDSQYLRFDQLQQVFATKSFTCADIGCGYGAFLDYLQSKGQFAFEYSGYDLSSEMIKKAKASHPESRDRFYAIDSLSEVVQCDYAIASGIYNVRQTIKDQEWNSYIKNSLREIDAIARQGFSFNILTAYSDIEKRRDYLYYASPEEFFEFCKENFSKNVALLHNYDLYEFTIIVQK